MIICSLRRSRVVLVIIFMLNISVVMEVGIQVLNLTVILRKQVMISIVRRIMRRVRIMDRVQIFSTLMVRRIGRVLRSRNLRRDRMRVRPGGKVVLSRTMPLRGVIDG